MRFEGIGWANTFGPLLGLTLLAVALPFITVPRATRSQARLALGVALAAGLTLAAAAGFYAWGYDGALPRRSVMTALAWGPALALAWLVRAQAVERRRGEDVAREGRG